ncbi:hypothetical protein ACFQ21_29880 [Ohtaekwangia kribbensis]|jgi:hypothetical protein|uniref:Uncharacterized protein n=1 Tax=Ohtaekwangia kribbensis TaxID=688913 RepID=A0ABW3KF70_9BACT
MIILSTISNLYCIVHISRQVSGGSVYMFDKHLLPENTLRHIRYNRLFNTMSNTLYALNDVQDKEIASILQKLHGEKNSGYRFSNDLQKTYLLELIHFITKIHLKIFPGVHTSLN